MRARLWLAGLTVVVVGVVLSARAAMVPVAFMAGADQASGAGQVSGSWTAKTHPEWKGDDVVPRVQLSLRTVEDRDHWGFGVPIAELTDLPGAAREGVVREARFTLTREAGMFRFTGSFEGGQAAGTFVFLPNAGYVTAMAGLGYHNLPRETLMRLAVLDVTAAFTRDLRDAGQSNLTLDDLTRMKIHGVTTEFIAGLKSRSYTGLTADDYTRMRIHGVTLAEVDALVAAGLRGLSADDLVRLRIHKVDAAFVRDARTDGLQVVTADDAVDLAIHGRRWRRR